MAPEPQRYSPNPTLTPEQHHVLALLADGLSIIAAANLAGVHRNTVRNWRRTVPAFAREIEFAVREQAIVWNELALHLAPKASRILETVMNDEDLPIATRVRTVLALVKMAANPEPRSLRVVQAAPQIENDAQFAQSCTSEMVPTADPISKAAA